MHDERNAKPIAPSLQGIGHLIDGPNQGVG